MPAWAVGRARGAAAVAYPRGAPVSRVAVWQPLRQLCCARWGYFSVQKHPGLGGVSALQVGDGALQVGHAFQSWKGFNWAQT